MVLKTAVTFKDDVIKLIRLREEKSANFMHFHFADNRTVQEEKNLAYKKYTLCWLWSASSYAQEWFGRSLWHTQQWPSTLVLPQNAAGHIDPFYFPKMMMPKVWLNLNVPFCPNILLTTNTPM